MRLLRDLMIGSIAFALFFTLASVALPPMPEARWTKLSERVVEDPIEAFKLCASGAAVKVVGELVEVQLEPRAQWIGASSDTDPVAYVGVTRPDGACVVEGWSFR